MLAKTSKGLKDLDVGKTSKGLKDVGKKSKGLRDVRKKIKVIKAC